MTRRCEHASKPRDECQCPGEVKVDHEHQRRQPEGGAGEGQEWQQQPRVAQPQRRRHSHQSQHGHGQPPSPQRPQSGVPSLGGWRGSCCWRQNRQRCRRRCCCGLCRGEQRVIRRDEPLAEREICALRKRLRGQTRLGRGLCLLCGAQGGSHWQESPESVVLPPLVLFTARLTLCLFTVTRIPHE